ncbi:hypothetical protein PENSPDRAFT_717917, partial [Peniophora sp. CONT]
QSVRGYAVKPPNGGNGGGNGRGNGMGPFGFPGMRMAPEGGKGEALKEYGVDLTEMAKAGKLDPVIGRDEDSKFISAEQAGASVEGFLAGFAATSTVENNNDSITH